MATWQLTSDLQPVNERPEAIECQANQNFCSRAAVVAGSDQQAKEEDENECNRSEKFARGVLEHTLWSFVREWMLQSSWVLFVLAAF